MRSQILSNLRRLRFASFASTESQRAVELDGRHVLVFSGQTLFNSTVTTSRSCDENSSTVLAGSVNRTERCSADSNWLALKFFRFRKVWRMTSGFTGLMSSEAITSL